MSSHLCLKWNNHSSSFLKSISKIQIQEKYCDATIVCQGKYFSVHRIVLSTCSEYFEEIFERIECQHPYIVFKDTEPKEMEMLLNYMYQGEVNVVQEVLPSLIKAAESLKIRGLAVSDDLLTNEDSFSKRKRSNSSSDNPQPKRRHEESRRKRDKADVNTRTVSYDEDHNNDVASSSSELPSLDALAEYSEGQSIKKEPSDPPESITGMLHNMFEERVSGTTEYSLPSIPSNSGNKNEKVSMELLHLNQSIKTEDPEPADERFNDESSSWGDFSRVNILQSLSSGEMSRPDDMYEINVNSETDGSRSKVNCPRLSEASQEQEGLLVFQRSVNSQGIPAHQCPFCDYQSLNNDHVKNHVRYKHTGERPYPCSVCVKRFVKKDDLNRHMRIHTGEKRFECPKCNKRFRHKDSLKYHLLKVKKCRTLSV